jgi:hypothetical protein
VQHISHVGSTSALGDGYIDPSARALAFPFFAPCDSRKSTLKLEQLHANVE